MPKKKPLPDELFAIKMQFLKDAEAAMGKRVGAHQRLLLDNLLAEYLPEFDLDESGIISSNTKNISLLAKVERQFDKIQKALVRDVLAPFARDLIKGSVLSADYYAGLGFKRTVVDGVLRTKVRVADRIGITASGRLRKDGYLHRLALTDPARQTLKNYVLRSLTGDVSFTDFQLGMRNLVIGNKKVKSLPTTGVLDRYFDQYAYDKFNEVDNLANRQIADELQLKHFIYEGSLIKTSRRFCEKRAGKAFSVAETKQWKNDPDLIDKKTADTYNPMVELGRYRCRHFPKYITEQTYKALTQ